MRADLLLWRHAEAIELGESGDDLSRALTPQGERQAQRMAVWLNRQLPADTHVLVSPARRAQQTAQALGRRFKTHPALAPDGTVEGMLQSARWPQTGATVLVIGHQPTLGRTAHYLVTGEPQPWPLRKGAFVWLRARERGGTQEVVVHAVLGPDLL